MSFRKKTWIVTVRRLRLNFDTLLAEVERGRTLRIADHNCCLRPLSLKERIAWRRKRRRPEHPRKPHSITSSRKADRK